MNNHWTYYLSEAGTIKRYGVDQLIRAMTIKRLEKELEEARRIFEIQEKNIEQLALTDWPLAEIEEAKIKSQQS